MNAALKEFAQKGFKYASTDVIVKEAVISKGALFHYFKNKKGLFLFLYDYAIDVVKNDMIMKFNYEEKDIFVRRRQAMLLKIEILKKYPEIYDFLAVAYLEDSAEVKNELEIKNKEAMTIGKNLLHEGIDTSSFKQGVDVKKAIDIITWTVEGFINRETEKLKKSQPNELNYDEEISELDIYFEILKKIFYK